MTKINVVNNNNVSFPKFVVGNLPHPNLQAEDPQQKPLGMTALCNTPSPRCLHTRPSPSRERVKESVLMLSPSGERGNNNWSPSPVGEKGTEGRMRGKGFTLIELLVVVLIIGILAAVALPQYQKAVEKSRAVQVLSAVKMIGDAQETYYLEHGEYASSLDQLDVNIPLDTTRYRMKIASPVTAAPESIAFVSYHKDPSTTTMYYMVRLPHDPNIYCRNNLNKHDIYKICEGLSGGKTIRHNNDTLYVVSQ